MDDRRAQLTGLSTLRIERLVLTLHEPRRRGRPWRLSPRRRVLLVCTALRTNLTFRELAAIFRTSKSAVHRIVDRLCRQIGSLNSKRAFMIAASRGSSTEHWSRPAITLERRNRRTIGGRAMSRYWCAAATFASLRSAAVGPEIETTRSTTERPCSRHFVGATDESSPTAAIEASPSSRRQSSKAITSVATRRGAPIGRRGRESSTHSRA